jgi:hypothetical protein
MNNIWINVPISLTINEIKPSSINTLLPGVTILTIFVTGLILTLNKLGVLCNNGKEKYGSSTIVPLLSLSPWTICDVVVLKLIIKSFTE